jgi:pSer/pThr/pTyr-binding forkhead associated (FHA) protein
MFYRLIQIDSARGREAQQWIVRPPATIGRSSELEVSIDDESVSRAHCQLFLNSEGVLAVRDMGSKNGTYVNDSRVHHANLIPGDLLQLGSVTLRVEYASDTDPGKPQQRPQPKSVSTTVTQPVRVIQTEQPANKPWWNFW